MENEKSMQEAGSKVTFYVMIKMEFDIDDPMIHGGR